MWAAPGVTRLFGTRLIKVMIGLLVVVNVFYFSSLILEPPPEYLSRTKHHSGKSGPSSTTVLSMPFITSIPERAPPPAEVPSKPLYKVPDVPYSQLSDSDKILHKLNEVTLDKEEHWLVHTDLEETSIQVNANDWTRKKWADNPTLYYDPRFTLSIYINEIKNQYLRKNPTNDKNKVHEIVVPFSWSDWVDLTFLNQELTKPEDERKTCEYMKETHHVGARDPNYCINYQDLTEDDLKEMGVPSTKFLPGFAVKTSPANKATNEVRMYEGKTNLLTYAKVPLSIIFMSDDGVYEAKIDRKQRLVDSHLFEDYLTNNGIELDEQNGQTIVDLDPVREFRDFTAKVNSILLDPEDDEYGMVAKIKETDPLKSRELYLPQTAFNYQQDKMDKQIAEYEDRIERLRTTTTNELLFDAKTVDELRFNRNEKMYYESLQYANTFDIRKEETYFRMARLQYDRNDPHHDAGWHYEWRFFNGALRYLKDGWNEEELLNREKILLDRILRNWFKFANEKGIISWIAHGPLLSWYWDGLLFPFDEDIDIQMPAEELVRFSKLYNQTLVVEDINEGYGKYFIDCLTFVHHRGKSHKENHIDARFIDIDTGSYIDITGLGVSDEKAPEKYAEEIQRAEDEGRPRPVYNCRNLHFYSYDELLPLRFTMLGGVPLYVPNKIQEMLNDEYSVGMKLYNYMGFFFVDSLNLWVHQLKLEFLFEGKDYKADDGMIDREKFTDLVKALTDRETLQLLEADQETLHEYYLTKDATETHRKELEFMFAVPNGEQTLIGDVGDQKDQSSISDNEEYHRLTSQFKLLKPFRRPLYNYETIDRPRHHRVPKEEV